MMNASDGDNNMLEMEVEFFNTLETTAVEFFQCRVEDRNSPIYE